MFHSSIVGRLRAPDNKGFEMYPEGRTTLGFDGDFKGKSTLLIVVRAETVLLGASIDEANLSFASIDYLRLRVFRRLAPVFLSRELSQVERSSIHKCA